MDIFNILAVVGTIVAVILAVVGLIVAIVLRRVVPTNMVHIVQSSKATTSYGKGKESGNTYYAWPSWVPVIGVTVLEFPESIFKVTLTDYEAYDQARLPFMVDVTAFFRVDHSETAAQRVASFEELEEQLDAVLKGAVRRILATNTLEQIMEARSELGRQFTAEVDEQIKEWGVKTVKTIEFMDLRDSKASGSKVIHNIMAKEQSRIDQESRVAVANNDKTAQLAEIDAKRTVEVQNQDAAQQVGIRTAEKDKIVGLAREASNQEVQTAAAVTAEKTKAVERVKATRQAEIDRDVLLVESEAKRDAMARIAEGDLLKTQRHAEGVLAEGTAAAAAQEKMLMAPVSAQITLAKEIGGNEGYQTYLIKLEQVKAGEKVGLEMAGALKEADLKIISNGSGGDLTGGVAKLADVFTVGGGTSLAGMLAALSQTDEGKALVDKLTK